MVYGVRVEDRGFRVEDLESRVSGLGFRILVKVLAEFSEKHHLLAGNGCFPSKDTVNSVPNPSE